jgi:hypothetical protein
MSADPRIERLRRVLLARISTYGYTHQGVLGAAASGKETFTYTIGLPAHIGHPELAVCGVASEKVIPVIGAVVEVLRSTPTLEGCVTGALEGDMPLWIATLPADVVAEHLGGACWWRREHHDGQPATAKQVIVPDPAGLFPWEPGCEAGYGRMQSLLLPEIAVRKPGGETAHGGDDARG